MELMNDIIQKELATVIDNAPDKMGNKIKLRRASHENLVKHLQNIPYMVVKKSDTAPMTPEKTNLSKDSKEWSLTSEQHTDYMDGPRKPINVKESMLENLKRHGSDTNNLVVENNDTVVQTEPTTDVVDGKLAMDDKLVMDNKSTVDNNSIVLNTQFNNMDIDKTFEEVNNVRQQVLSVKENATQAEQEANESDRTVQELGIQYTETEKQLQEAEVRKQEIKQKIVAALSSQTTTLTEAKKKYELLIEDANRRKEKNENKIMEFRTKIDGTKAKITAVNDDIARQQEILNALMELDNVVGAPAKNDESEDRVRKIA